MKKGKLFVISGPSGTGKGTICERIINENDDVALSVSMTTREPREGEIDGVNYYFVSDDEFQKVIDEDGFLEYACVYRHSYGTPKQAVLSKLEQGIDVILEIDTQGAMNIKKKYPEGVFIFIKPPSLQELRHRIESRGKDDQETIELRLSEAEKEMGLIDEYDHCVVNDDLDEAVEKVRNIMKEEKNAVSCN